jgi:nicotinamidase-related amidase
VTEHERIQAIVRIKGEAPLPLDPPKSALIVVDMQRYFVRPDYPFAQTIEKAMPGATTGYFERVNATVLGNVQRLLAAFRSRHLPVIYLGVGRCLEDGRDLPAWMRDFDQAGLAMVGERVHPPVNHPSWQIDDSVAPIPGEMMLNKTSSGALASTKLDQTLHNLGVTSLVVCGLTTAVCVTQTARETADRGFRVAIAEDACTEMSVELHDAALLAFGWVFGRVSPTGKIVSLFETTAQASA